MRVQNLWLLNKRYPQGRSQKSVYQSWIAEYAFTCFILACIISSKHIARSIHTAMILYIHILNMWCHIRGKIASWVPVRVEGGVAGEGRVFGIPKFYSWSKCTMPLTNINLDWMSNTSSGLCINLYYVGPYFHMLGCNYLHGSFYWLLTLNLNECVQTLFVKIVHVYCSSP